MNEGKPKYFLYCWTTGTPKAFLMTYRKIEWFFLYLFVAWKLFHIWLKYLGAFDIQFPLPCKKLDCHLQKGDGLA